MISAIVLTKNEQTMLEPCLKSLSWADEIVVIDDNSADGTVVLAKTYTDKIFVHGMQSFAAQRNFAMEKAAKEWVLFVDADERVTKQLREEILQICHPSVIPAQSDTAAVYAIPRQNFFLGREQKFVGGWPDYVVRLIKKSSFKEWGGELHENPVFGGELRKLSSPLIHLTHRDITSMTLKTLEWSKKEAELRFHTNHPKMTSWRFLRIVKTSFLYWYILKGGWRGGTEGAIEAIFQTFSMFFSYARLWEMQQQPSLAEKYKQIDQHLEESDFTNT